MSEYLHQKGYIYPLGKLSDEENNSIYKKIKGEENFELDRDKFELEYMGKNDYLIWLTYSTYGEKSGEFGSCRHCNQQEIYFHAPKFREILGKIDTKKLKYIDFCYYNSTECTTDYYLSEEQVSETDAIQAAIQHCKTQAPRNCGVMYEQYTAVAEWLQELVDSRIKIKRLATELKADHQKAIDTANELAAYKDKTYIEPDFLIRNGFEKRQFDYLYCDDSVEISAQCVDREAGIWRIEVAYLDSGYPQTLDICTLGQLRMFLAIEGLENIANQFK